MSQPPRPLLIGDRRVSTTQTRTVRDPFTGEPVGDFCLAGEPELRDALVTAEKAFAETRRQLPDQRAELLGRVADALARRADEFAQLIVAEAGKPITLAEGEVARCVQTFRFAAREAARFGAGEPLAVDASAPGRGHTGLVRWFPLGIVLAITPFNFPLNLVAHKIAPALAVGNTVLLKPSPRTPLTAHLLGEVLLEAGMPPGQVNVVPCDTAFVPRLTGDARVKVVSFTGSAAVGWELKARCQPRQKVTLELGGNAAVIVHSDARWPEALPLIASGAFAYAGQSCISVQRIYVQREVYADFKAGLLTYLKENMRAGDPRDRAVIVGPVIDTDARDRILAWVDEALKAGAKLLTDLHPRPADRVLPPILLEGMPPGAKASCEEVFGPVALLETYGTFEEALRKANDSPYGLQAGVFTQDVSRAWQAFETLEVGGVLINQAPTYRVENMPYGGVKDSGFGREGLHYAMEEMTEPRAMICRLAHLPSS